MLKKAIIPWTLLISVLLFGCNGESETVVLDDSKSGVNDVSSLVESEAISKTKFLSELKNEIINSTTKQFEINSDSIAVSLGGNPDKGIIDVSVGFPTDMKIDDTTAQQIVKDSINKVSEKENITIKEENTTIKIEEY